MDENIEEAIIISSDLRIMNTNCKADKELLDEFSVREQNLEQEIASRVYGSDVNTAKEETVGFARSMCAIFGQPGNDNRKEGVNQFIGLVIKPDAKPPEIAEHLKEIGIEDNK